MAHEDMENEQSVPRHLEGWPGIVRCLGMTPKGIELGRMKQGPWEKYIEKHQEEPPLRIDEAQIVPVGCVVLTRHT